MEPVSGTEPSTVSASSWGPISLRAVMSLRLPRTRAPALAPAQFASITAELRPGTVAGLAVSGGKARASLPGMLGKIDADVFQAGLYGVMQLGPVKLGGAASYARLENDVSRGIPALGSSLASSYAAMAWSERLQASAALFDWNGLSFSPLAAIQATQARSRMSMPVARCASSIVRVAEPMAALPSVRP